MIQSELLPLTRTWSNKMGLFSRSRPRVPGAPDEQLVSALVQDTESTRKRLAKDQALIGARLKDGERVVLLNWSSRPQASVDIVTDRRVVQVLRGGVVFTAEAVQIRATTLMRMPWNAYSVSIEGSSILLEIGSHEDANRVALQIDRLYDLS